MPRQLARLLGFVTRRERSLKRETEAALNEVSEHEGVLLVRLAKGSAMQVRIEPPIDPAVARAQFRIVPIAEARQLHAGAPWQAASETQLEAWIHSDSAVGQWLSSQRLGRKRAAAAAAGDLLSVSTF